MPNPIYTPSSCNNPAYQLNWTYTLFWREPPHDLDWLGELTALCEDDGIRILSHDLKRESTSQFLLSTRPALAPLKIAQRTKGRLQHLIRGDQPRAFMRKYGLRSVGSTKGDKLERYLTIQVEHHPMADPSVSQRLAEYQIDNPDVDLAQPRSSSHARYWYNLHIVMANDHRHMEIRDSVLRGLRDRILAAASRKQHWLSRAAIVPDHIHLTIGCRLEETPEEVVLSYMNNLAHACGMKEVFSHSYFVGTFGDYDLGAIPRV